MLLIAGGELDPNIDCLLKAAKRLRRPCTALLVGAGRHPVLSWEIANDRLVLDGRRIKPTSAFVRHDVFGHMNDERSETAFRAFAWYSTVTSYVDAHADIKCFNRRHDGGGTKPHQLFLAKKVGLSIPWTLVTNDAKQLRGKGKPSGLVVKPVNGGEYCQKLDDVFVNTQVKGRAAASPAIVQEELVRPDIRIYRIGKRYLSFTIASKVLDYRTTNDVRVTENSSIDGKIRKGLERITNELGLDYAAADFKADAKSGKLKFLEVNSAPMFVAFDAASKGKLTKAILDYLAGE